MADDLENGAAPKDRGAGARRLVALAYILAVSIPPFGMVVGATLVLRPGKGYSRHGVAVIAISIVVAIVWIVIATSGALNTPTTGY